MEAKKILIVEDHPDLGEIIQKQLALVGYAAALNVHSGADALRTIQREKPDLILMDIHLPGMSGLEVARGLKADPNTRTIPILGMTASAAPIDREMCARSGCDGFLAKPFLIHQLKSEIEKLLNRSH